MNTRRLIFTHIQKAAGNSVNVFFDTIRERLGANVLAIAGAPDREAGTPAALLATHGLDYEMFDIITGHIPFAAARQCFGDATFATVLRAPAARMLSDFCSQPQHLALPDGGLSLSNLIGTTKSRAIFSIDNLQVRMLCDNPNFALPATRDMLAQAQRNLLMHYSFVGFTEEIEGFFCALSAAYSVAPPRSWPRINVTPTYADKIRARHHLFAAWHNRLDAALYRWARRQQFSPVQLEMPLGSGQKTIAGLADMQHFDAV